MREEHAGPVGYAARPARSDFRVSTCANGGAFRNPCFLVLVNTSKNARKRETARTLGTRRPRRFTHVGRRIAGGP